MLTSKFRPCNIKSKFHSNAALPTLLSKLIPMMRSRTSAQLLFSAHNNVHILTLDLYHFLILYPLPEGRMGIAWELQVGKFFCSPSLNVVSLTTSLRPHFLYFLSLSFPLSSGFNGLLCATCEMKCFAGTQFYFFRIKLFVSM
jgi:hypothetical protein